MVALLLRKLLYKKIAVPLVVPKSVLEIDQIMADVEKQKVF